MMMRRQQHWLNCEQCTTQLLHTALPTTSRQHLHTYIRIPTHCKHTTTLSHMYTAKHRQLSKVDTFPFAPHTIHTVTFHSKHCLCECTGYTLRLGSTPTAQESGSGGTQWEWKQFIIIIESCISWASYPSPNFTHEHWKYNRFSVQRNNIAWAHGYLVTHRIHSQAWQHTHCTGECEWRDTMGVKTIRYYHWKLLFMGFLSSPNFTHEHWEYNRFWLQRTNIAWAHCYLVTISE